MVAWGPPPMVLPRAHTPSLIVKTVARGHAWCLGCDRAVPYDDLEQFCPARLTDGAETTANVD